MDRLPSDRQPTLRVVPMPADTNQGGSIFGGRIRAVQVYSERYNRENVTAECVKVTEAVLTCVHIENRRPRPVPPES